MKTALQKYYIDVLKKYVVFSGRARRTEYWLFLLFNIIAGIAIGFIEGVFQVFPENKESILGNIYNIAIIIPTIAVGVRRMHDTNHNGWWVICPVVNFVFLVINGDKGPNKYGPDPKVVS